MTNNCKMITLTVPVCLLAGGLLVCGCSHASHDGNAVTSPATSSAEQRILNDPNVSEGQKQAMLRTIPPPMRHASQP